MQALEERLHVRTDPAHLQREFAEQFADSSDIVAGVQRRQKPSKHGVHQKSFATTLLFFSKKGLKQASHVCGFDRGTGTNRGRQPTPQWGRIFVDLDVDGRAVQVEKGGV